MDYKDTLNLPKTDFPMKANLAKREPEYIEHWDKSLLYKSIIQKKRGLGILWLICFQCLLEVFRKKWE